MPGIGWFCLSEIFGGIDTIAPRKFVPPASRTAAEAPSGIFPFTPTNVGIIISDDGSPLSPFSISEMNDARSACLSSSAAETNPLPLRKSSTVFIFSYSFR